MALRHVSLDDNSSCDDRSGQRRKAFTIIELLVVISIIVLLIAMLLPSLRSARVHARNAYCKSTMRQLVAACLAYSADHEGKIPPNRMNYDGHSKFVTWRVLVADNGYYARDGQSWECPEDVPPIPGWSKSALSELDSGGVHGTACEDDIASNFAFNGSEFWRWANWGAAQFVWQQEVRIETLGSPSTTFMILETRNVFPDLGVWTVGWKNSDGGGSIGFWHDHGANWAKADGNVEWATVPESGAPVCWWHDPQSPTYTGNYGNSLPMSLGGHAHPEWPGVVNTLYLKP